MFFNYKSADTNNPDGFAMYNCAGGNGAIKVPNLCWWWWTDRSDDIRYIPNVPLFSHVGSSAWIIFVVIQPLIASMLTTCTYSYYRIYCIYAMVLYRYSNIILSWLALLCPKVVTWSWINLSLHVALNQFVSFFAWGWHDQLQNTWSWRNRAIRRVSVLPTTKPVTKYCPSQLTACFSSPFESCDEWVRSSFRTEEPHRVTGEV